MQTVQLFSANGRPRCKNSVPEIVSGQILGKRISHIDAKPGLVIADIILAQSPGPGLSRHITAFIEGEV